MSNQPQQTHYEKKSDRIQGFVSYQKASAQSETPFKLSTKTLQKRYQKILDSLRHRQPKGEGNLSHRDAEELLTRFKQK